MKNSIMPGTRSVLVAAALATVVWVSAGSLTPPPGPVSPTMKTLVDVEPRTAIRNDPNFAAPVVISFPGSYYLAEDIDAIFNQHGITINASHVTLDLNGFTVRGNLEVGSLNGIHIDFERDNVTIKNGTVRDFGGTGIYGPLTDGGFVENIRVINNGDQGIYLQEFARIKDCMAIYNGANGIVVGQNAIVSGCLTVSNGTEAGDAGIRIGGVGAMVFNCTANANSGYGMWIGEGGLVSSSIVHANGHAFGIVGAAGDVLVHGSTVTGHPFPINGIDIDCHTGP